MTSGMKQLEVLDLGWCGSITDADVKALAALTAITALQLSRTLVRLLMHETVSRKPTRNCLPPLFVC